MKCRSCLEEVSTIFIDLGNSPIANNLLERSETPIDAPTYPLKVFVCDYCALVQLPNLFSESEIFGEDYVYYSSYSDSWLDHSKKFADEISVELSLGEDDLVLEIASNDGYLLQYFSSRNIKVLGVEPTAGPAKIAISQNIPTEIQFLGKNTALALRDRGISPKLIVANNVLAHVPNLRDFVEGISLLANDQTVITIEFPHLLKMIRNCQFDTIYHEHFSYLSVTSMRPLFLSFGLSIIDIREIGTHGGSLRLYLMKNSKFQANELVERFIQSEAEYDPRLDNVKEKFSQEVLKIRHNLLSEFEKWNEAGFKVIAYGAAAKGNTLLNFCGIDSSMIRFAVDRNPRKQGRLLPGSNIPIMSEDSLDCKTFDVVLILPWNISQEIADQLVGFKEHGKRFVRAIPELEYL